jgi:hypothetical protein
VAAVVTGGHSARKCGQNERMPADVLSRLAAWYAEQLDGDWEHDYGITITSLDNPGWWLKVDLTGTELAGGRYPKTEVRRSDTDWLVGYIEEVKFQVACGPGNLEEAIELFLTWAASQRAARA